MKICKKRFPKKKTSTNYFLLKIFQTIFLMNGQTTLSQGCQGFYKQVNRLCLRHCPSDIPDTMVNLAVPSWRVYARAEANRSAHVSVRSNSAPALAQVTTVPGPTVQAASMVQYNMEASSCTRFDLIMLTLVCPAHNCS